MALIASIQILARSGPIERNRPVAISVRVHNIISATARMPPTKAVRKKCLCFQNNIGTEINAAPVAPRVPLEISPIIVKIFAKMSSPFMDLEMGDLI